MRQLQLHLAVMEKNPILTNSSWEPWCDRIKFGKCTYNFCLKRGNVLL